MLIGIVLVLTLSAGYLVVLAVPDLQLWMVSAIHAVHEEWISWGWTPL